MRLHLRTFDLDLRSRLRARAAGVSAPPLAGSPAEAATVGEPLTILTADGVLLAGAHWRARDADQPAFVVAHGFTGSMRRESVQAIVGGLLAHGSVLAFDFRGHGRSGGRCTAGDAEVLDVRAAVACARGLGHRRIVTVGFSMGGAVVVRQAADQGLDDLVDAVVSVSAPSRWFVRDTEPMRRVHWLCETTTGRLAARVVLNTRLARGWSSVPPTPIEVAHRIAPTPLLVVHGTADRYFGVEHPRALATAGGPDTELWIIEGMGHAESAASSELIARIARWSLAHTGDAMWAGR